LPRERLLRQADSANLAVPAAHLDHFELLRPHGSTGCVPLQITVVLEAIEIKSQSPLLRGVIGNEDFVRFLVAKRARTGPSRSVVPIDPDQPFQAIPINRSD
jgi:hypothetical protein